MYVYIDALFKAHKSGNEPAPQTGAGDFFTSDDIPAVAIPPARFVPYKIALVTDKGEVSTFDNDIDCSNGATAGMLSRLSSYISTRMLSGEVFVGWNLSRVVLPSICTQVFLRKVVFPARYMQRLDDKWARPIGYSVERAVTQGWYPLDRAADSRTTLADAYESAFGESFDSLVDNLGGRGEGNLLVARLSAASQLFARYENMLRGMQ